MEVISPKMEVRGIPVDFRLPALKPESGTILQECERYKKHQELHSRKKQHLPPMGRTADFGPIGTADFAPRENVDGTRKNTRHDLLLPHARTNIPAFSQMSFLGNNIDDNPLHARLPYLDHVRATIPSNTRVTGFPSNIALCSGQLLSYPEIHGKIMTGVVNCNSEEQVNFPFIWYFVKICIKQNVFWDNTGAF